MPRYGHRCARGAGQSGLDEPPADLGDRPERLKGRGRWYVGVEQCLPPPLENCQAPVGVGAGGVRSRVRRIFLRFYNPTVRPVAFGGAVLPMASMITVKAAHVRGILPPAHLVRAMWVMGL